MDYLSKNNFVKKIIINYKLIKIKTKIKWKKDFKFFKEGYKIALFLLNIIIYKK